MELPKTNSELKVIFRNASPPDISEFSGEYLVDMLTVFPSFKRFGHRKVFYHENGRIMGHNVLFNRRWGHFSVHEGVCGELDLLEAAVINYDRKENTFPVRRIRDHVRRIQKDALYMGRFNYLISGKLLFLGYFSLEKIGR
jgi:hypothetical protein